MKTTLKLFVGALALMALSAQASAQTFLLRQSLIQTVVLSAVKALAVAGAASVSTPAAAAKGQEAKPAAAAAAEPDKAATAPDSPASSEPVPPSVERLLALTRSDAEFTDAEKAKIAGGMAEGVKTAGAAPVSAPVIGDPLKPELVQSVATKAAGDLAVLQVSGKGQPLAIVDQATRQASWLFGAISKKLKEASEASVADATKVAKDAIAQATPATTENP